LFAFYDDCERHHKKTIEQWSQYKAVKEMPHDFEKIVLVKNKKERTQYWASRFNRMFQRKEKSTYKEIEVESVLDFM